MEVPKTIYHVVQAKVWKAALDQGKEYYPETYEADGFIHATSDVSVFLDILNNYYRSIPGEFLCLAIDTDVLESTVKMEPPAPVGKTPSGVTVERIYFPHIFGPLKPLSCVVKEIKVKRSADGAFTAIEGVCE